MRLLSSLAFALLFGPLLPAQGTEWVTNGSFTGTLTPWVMGGAYSVNPGLEAGWDTTGMGASDSFGVNAGGQATPSPYPPNTLEQQILVVQGLTYEFRCDASGARPLAPTVNNSDIGTIWVEVDAVEVARLAFGSYTNNNLPGGEVKRAQVCGRFTPTTTGQVTLRIFFQRRFLGGAVNPRMNIDNVSVRDVYGPTYWIAGNRKIGTTLLHQVATAPGALFGVFAAVAENAAGTTFPGVAVPWRIDLPTTTMLAFGLADATGLGSASIAVPNDPLFLGTPLWYQAAAMPTQIEFGYHFGAVCTQ